MGSETLDDIKEKIQNAYAAVGNKREKSYEKGRAAFARLSTDFQGGFIDPSKALKFLNQVIQRAFMFSGPPLVLKNIRKTLESNKANIPWETLLDQCSKALFDPELRQSSQEYVAAVRLLSLAAQVAHQPAVVEALKTKEQIFHDIPTPEFFLESSSVRFHIRPACLKNVDRALCALYGTLATTSYADPTSEQKIHDKLNALKDSITKALAENLHPQRRAALLHLSDQVERFISLYVPSSNEPIVSSATAPVSIQGTGATTDTVGSSDPVPVPQEQVATSMPTQTISTASVTLEPAPSESMFAFDEETSMPPGQKALQVPVSSTAAAEAPSIVNNPENQVARSTQPRWIVAKAPLPHSSQANTFTSPSNSSSHN